MEKIVDIVAPVSLLDLFIKAIILVACFTGFDYFVAQATHVWTDGSTISALVVTFMIGAPFGLFVMAVMTVQRRLKDRLIYLSSTDVLTGLLNRRTFFDRADDVLDAGNGVAVLMIDVDFFKAVNDTHGHYAGDIALIEIGKHLQHTTRDCDIVGRIGGEEFAVLLRASEGQSIKQVVEQVFAPIRVTPTAEVPTAFTEFAVTLSIGAAISVPGVPLIALLGLADRALYAAKSTGRNKIVYHDKIDPNTDCLRVG